MSELRTLGGSGLATPRLVLGGNVFGWTATDEEAFRVLDRFAGAGGTMVDTADVYSAWVKGNRGGESEALIGAWLRRRRGGGAGSGAGGGGGLKVATKVGMLPGEGGEGLSAKRIEAAAEASLKRLGIETIDLYYAHRDDPETPLDETLAAFHRLVAGGKVRALGASNYSADRLAAALASSRQAGISRFEVLQPEYHLLARDGFEGPLQRLCLDQGLGVLPYFGLASGFLTGKYRSREDIAKSVRGSRMAGYMEGKGPAVLAALDAIAAEAGATPAQVALAWLAAQPGVTAPIASARTEAQLDELIGAMELELTAAQLAALDAASRS